MIASCSAKFWILHGQKQREYVGKSKIWTVKCDRGASFDIALDRGANNMPAMGHESPHRELFFRRLRAALLPRLALPSITPRPKDLSIPTVVS
jgi:hypothetical protein